MVCTDATHDLCAIMLAYSGHIQESDVKWFNKRRVTKGLEPVEPIYTKKEANGCCIILAHNHPSGSTKPSEADIQLTKKMKEGREPFGNACDRSPDHRGLRIFQLC